MEGPEIVNLEEILESLRESLAASDVTGAVALIQPLRPPDQAALFEELSREEQAVLLPRLAPEDAADIFEEMDDALVAEIAAHLEPANLSRIVNLMEPDEAADLLGDLTDEQANQVLAAIQQSSEVIPLMTYPDESAGGVMTAVDFTLYIDMTVQQAIDFLRQESPDSEQFYYLFVVDQDRHLVGVVSLRQLIVSSPQTRIGEIMNPDVISINAGTDGEDAARVMARYDLLALPVVDDENCLVGLITYDDSIDLLEDEATEDIYRLGGVPERRPADMPLGSAMRSRLPWLALNLITALVSATVLSLFEGTIARVAALAAFFPIVAGVSGSAATQTLTVTVRGLALGELSPRDAFPTLGREMLVGVLNGIAIGGLIAVIALIWKGEPVLGALVGGATLLNMLCASLAGVLVPLLVQRLNFDPALASPILVTTTTDTLGYLFYLGMATVLIAFLV